ncbi:TlpA family protein disulfide reductase [Halobacillus litoralis]|uniref:TlpA family protein disulfide reductase n=1 Tax=Halobacillus litoralis TaxID=45668 RepID=UPI001CD75ABF|nr:TlpA disulfide reductase family protein [Halobacillus litoralis]MCA0971740.1 TlpA family protein disulfide reductase [Halobacillus litoralis]
MNQAPDFELSYMFSDDTFRLSEQKGKATILTFWASWCPDSSRDLPKKEQLYKTMNHEQIEMYTINVTGRERNEEEAVKYAEQFLTQPTLVDRGRDIYDLYNCDGVPSTIIIDREGKIVASFGDKAPFLDVVEAIGKVI